MPKQPRAVPLTDEEKKSLVDDPALALKIETIADGLFKGRFDDEVGEVKNEINGKFNNLTIGIVVATALVLLGLWWQTKQFMDSYQQHYLDTQANFSQQVNDLRKENLDLKDDVRKQVEEVRNENEYLQRLLMERSAIIQPVEYTPPKK